MVTVKFNKENMQLINKYGIYDKPINLTESLIKLRKEVDLVQMQEEMSDIEYFNWIWSSKDVSNSNLDDSITHLNLLFFLVAGTTRFLRICFHHGVNYGKKPLSLEHNIFIYFLCPDNWFL